MLLCPHCHSENPNPNKFCQKCGTSLTHKTCPTCHAEVSLCATNCQNCGTMTGTVWQAIIAKDPAPTVVQQASQATVLQIDDLTASAPTATLPEELTTPNVVEPLPATTTSEAVATETLPPTSVSAVEKQDPEDITQPLVTPTPTQNSVDDFSMQVLPSAGENVSTEQESSDVATAEYLDKQQRYKLLDIPNLQETAQGILRVRVLDCQPLQQSPLEALLAGQQVSQPEADVWNALNLPAIAQQYLQLKQSFPITMPSVHDAWQDKGDGVVLLEDRSKLPLLVDLWRDASVPNLQILYGLGEMAKLWNALELWGYRQSLLEITNLRVDEDQNISLQSLYQEPESAELMLKDLGLAWQNLLPQSMRTQLLSLDLMLQDLAIGNIETVDELRTKLQAIATELEVRESASQDVTTPLTTNAAGELFADDEESNEGDDTPTVILPMQLTALEDAGNTDIGRQRDHNEDFFGIHTRIEKQINPMGQTVKARGLYIICDGMGGHASGEVASAMAVETIKKYFEEHWKDELPSEDSIRTAVLRANQAIYDVNQKNARSGSGRMGTTLVMLLVQETKLAIAHVGDSRLYRLTRKKGLEQITVDHEVGQREMQRGVEEAIAYSRPDAYQLTQALGPRDANFVNPDVLFLELHESTLLILASDGLTDNDLLEAHWQNNLLPLLNSRANLEQGVNQLIELGNQYNGHDNITAVLVRAKVQPNAEYQQRF